jgi:hypothetical protein
MDRDPPHPLKDDEIHQFHPLEMKGIVRKPTFTYKTIRKHQQLTINRKTGQIPRGVSSFGFTICKMDVTGMTASPVYRSDDGDSVVNIDVSTWKDATAVETALISD